jgi:hypothetical protein
VKIITPGLMKIYLYLFIFLLTCEIINAQSLVTDRPDQTESASVVGKGVLQIESGAVLSFTGENLITTREIFAPTSLFRIGITEGVEVRVMNQFETLKNPIQTIEGIGDLEAGVKIQLYQRDDCSNEVAFLSHLLIPSGTKALSNELFGTLNRLAISHEITENIGVGYNVGYNYFGSGKGDFVYSLALGFAVTDKTSLFIEPYGDLINFNDLMANFDAGITYLLNPDLQLDFAFGAGINHSMNFITAGISWRTGMIK